MRLDPANLKAAFLAAQQGKKSRHSMHDRLQPSLWQYDYLALSTLAADVRALIAEVPAGRGRALDLGAGVSPYREEVTSRGLALETMDIEPGGDHVGTVEHTGLPGASFELVLCTQVLEHCDDPWQGMREIHRILAPGGRAIVTAPHFWFYHPHPKDHWRFTQEGLVRLCREAGLEPLALLGQGGTILAAAQMVNFLIYGVLGSLGAPLYAAVSAGGGLLDRLAPNALLCHNFACLSAKPR